MAATRHIARLAAASLPMSVKVVLAGRSDTPWDPYGYCGEPGNPFG